MHRRLLLLLVGLLVFSTNMYSQQNDNELIDKIDLKLKNDKDYLNIHYVPMYPTDGFDSVLTSIPRVSKDTPFDFQVSENVTYRIVFLKEGLGIDSLYLLYVDEVRVNTGAESGFFGAIGDISDDTTVVLQFSDIHNLRENEPEYYFALRSYVDDYMRLNDQNPAESLLRINTEDDIKTSLGVSSRDNTDYINYAKTYEIHWFKNESGTPTRRGTRSASSSSDFKLDLSFSDISFSHESMNAFLEDGGASVEVDFGQPVVNVLPHQSMTVSAGLKMLFMLSGDSRGFKESTFLNAKFGARVNLKSTELYDAQPYIFGDDPLLNFGTGIFGEFNFSKIGNFPYLNFYFATGDDDVTDPTVFVRRGGIDYAYFTFNHAEASMSFYWNTSDALTSRFRMDIGGGYYDVIEGQYNNSGKLVAREKVYGKFQPMVALHYTWAPKSNPVMGAKVKFFDSVFNLNAWLTIFQISQNHLFRVEAIYITEPYFRDSKPWETEGGAMVQLRYRYGLTN